MLKSKDKQQSVRRDFSAWDKRKTRGLLVLINEKFLEISKIKDQTKPEK